MIHDQIEGVVNERSRLDGIDVVIGNIRAYGDEPKREVGLSRGFSEWQQECSKRVKRALGS